ncbi:MAG: M48 family metalloprotease [Bdellovibrionaceae bacterium]|nr:M48 family metalloprotease [Pseudobdellovibrionaceae bacterium]
MSNNFKKIFMSISLGLSLVCVPAHAVFVDEETSGPLNTGDENMVVTEPAEFTQMMRNIENIYDPIIQQLGGRLTIQATWGNATPNAYAKKTFKNWQVVITGGLARQPAMTKDGIVLVACHEIGHLVAGFPFVNTGLAALLGMDWVSTEGESDYYATRVCARKIWGKDTIQNEMFRSYASAYVKSECDKIWATEAEQNLCYRITTASESLGTVLANLAKTPKPSLHTPSTKIVATTFLRHPEAQCRLDTYFQGAICTTGWNDHVIPGRKQPGGKTGIAAEKQAAMASCTKTSGFSVGLRPTCWYKPRM